MNAKVITSTVPVTGGFRKVLGDSGLRGRIMERVVRHAEGGSFVVKIDGQPYRLETRTPGRAKR